MKIYQPNIKNGLKGLKMSKKDISVTQLEKLALTKNEKKTYSIMNRYYGISNLNENSMSTKEYIENLNLIIGENQNG